jgi:catechol 2,3-dioxygenase-like lactoylglutathione lyase family enzyme
VTLTTGFNHVATLTTDADRLVAFYGNVFGAVVSAEIPASSSTSGAAPR